MPQRNPKPQGTRKPQKPRKRKNPQNIKGNLPGSLTAYDKGNKHENGGIPIPSHNAEVERGETKHGEYIFSDAPDMKLTKSLAREHGIPEKYAGERFSDVSKKIEEKYTGERENDIYSNNAKSRELDALKEAQESKKQEKLQKKLGELQELMGSSGEDIMRGGGNIMDMLGEYEGGGSMQYEEGGNLTRAEMQAETRKNDRQTKQINSSVTSSLSAINPLLGAAYGVGSKAGNKIAPEGDRTVNDDDSSMDKVRKGAAWNVDPFGYAVQTTQEKGFNAESVGDIMISNTIPGGGTILANKVMEKGGKLDKYNYGGKYQEGGELTEGVLTMDDFQLEEERNTSFNLPDETNNWSQDRALSSSTTTSRPMENDRDPYDPMSPEQQREILRRRQNREEMPTEGGDPQYQDYGFDSSLSTMQKVAPFIKPAVGAATMIGGPEETDFRRVDPEEIDYEESREIAERQAALSRARTEEAIRRNANSAGQALQGNISANIASQRNLTNSLLQSRMKERNQNVGIRNRADRLNAQIQRQEAIADAKNRARFDQNLTGIADDVGRGMQGLERDRRRYRSQNRYNRAYMGAINNMADQYNYVTVEGEDGKTYRVPRFMKNQSGNSE